VRASFEVCAALVRCEENCPGCGVEFKLVKIPRREDQKFRVARTRFGKMIWGIILFECIALHDHYPICLKVSSIFRHVKTWS
jgi:hypothetical protein